MIFTWEMIIIPIMGALIGWLTNVVAIKMLFWPKRPVVIPVLGIEFYGLLPKRQADLARTIGLTVNEQLISVDDVIGKIEQSGYEKELVGMIVDHVDQRVQRALPRLLPENLKAALRDYIREAVAREAVLLLERAAGGMIKKFRADFDFGRIVEEKIRALDLDQLEMMIRGLAQTELRHIELLGALLGLLIGILQSMLLIIRFAM